MTTATLFCQSCGMPVASEEVHGTEHDGAKTDKYCTYCYQDGAFVQPDLTLKGMIEASIPYMVEEGMDEQHARELLQHQLPGLERWRGQQREADKDNDSGAVAAFSQPIVEPLVKQLDAFSIAGLAGVTANEAERGPDAKIAKLWERFWQQDQLQSLFSSGDEPHVSYGCYSNYSDGVNGSYQITVGCRIGSEQDVPEEWTRVDLPASRYAIFTSRRGPVVEVVVELWQHIWEWAETGSYKRTFTGDFERYDVRSANPNETVVEIYIAIAP
ncbi:effector binding domain-containing protein [Cohnella faecalis]|uniref:Transcriptional regulator n=1 Tax=Cohnella faecalis TaxID=2315694 RepID=A0A398CMR8_9BACL|nr:effector binding domain-containing protein [Cohnella faecalis]RIE01197.1 transcriptional regulator [Cohnella faecalis]